MNKDFKSSIRVFEDKERIRILDLQKRFKSGEISEEEIEYEDYEKLLELYDEQNQKLKDEIEKYKKETEVIIKKLKNQ